MCTQNNLNKSLVSIVIPTYSRPENLTRALESALAQTYGKIEIIVVDDNGLGTPFQKETELVMAPYITLDNVSYIKHPVNRNGSAARNTGLKASKGEYINFLDDDDVLHPQKIAIQVARLETAGEKFDACYCNTLVHLKDTIISNISGKEGYLLPEILIKKINFNTSAVLFRRSVLEELNGFDDSFFRHQDYELYMRFFRKHKICQCSDKILLEKYQTPNIITKNPHRIIEFKLKFLQEFKDDINKMDNSPVIWHFLFADTAASLFQNKLRIDAFNFLWKASKHKRPSFTQFLHYMKWWLDSYKS
jgi:glycosyltransferase involved in cell wall biosynthesis